MITIQDLNKLIKLPAESLGIDWEAVKRVLEFREESIPYVDNLNMFTVEYVNRLSDILNYWYMLQQNPWLKDKCVVGVMGAYSAGKSTLLNCLLGTDLPEDVNTATVMPAYVAYGSDNSKYFVDTDGNYKLLPREFHERLTRDEIKDFDLRKIIKNMVIYHRSPLLKKVTFLDTPGITADNPYDKETTADAAGKCNVVLWAIRAQKGEVSNDVLDFIKEHLSHAKIYVVITHADQTPNPDKIRDKIIKTMENAQVDVADYLFFSNDRPSRVGTGAELLKKIESVLTTEAENFTVFQPQQQLNSYFEFVKNHLNEKIEDVSTKKQKIEQILRQYEHRIESVKRSLSDSADSLSRSISNLQSTINSRCKNVIMCTGGAYGELVDCRNTMVDSCHSIFRSINEIDIEEIINYGKGTSVHSNLSDRLDSLVEERNQCVELMKKSSNLLK